MRSLTGSTQQGSPLASSREPASDLAPWAYWLSATEVRLPRGQKISCGMLSDQPCLRMLYGGTWTAETLEGTRVFNPGENGLTAYFGPQTRYMPISVTGSFKVITLQFHSGTAYVLGGPSMGELLDRIIDFDRLVGHGRLTSRIPIEESNDVWLDVLEGELRRFVATFEAKPPSSISTAFERACLATPEITINEFADRNGVSRRTVERIVKRDFGVSPKFALRRARALDMVATLLGVAHPEEEPEIRMRYFDQSHLIREIREFFDMSPSQLIRGAHPLLRLNVEIRQARRTRKLDLTFKGSDMPWRTEDPATGPSSPRR